MLPAGIVEQLLKLLLHDLVRFELTLNGLIKLFSQVGVFDPELLDLLLECRHVFLSNFLVVGNGINQSLRHLLFEISLLCEGR